VKDWAWRTGQ